MLSHIYPSLQNFFERNLFERIIIYIFLSHLIVTIIFEFILGQWSFAQSQNEQWVFYGLLGLDYLISFRKVINIRVTINPISIFAYSLFIMMAHGLFVGILNHNDPFTILNDTVPILMIALNILRMQSMTELSKPIDFRFIVTSAMFIVSGICFFGYLSDKPTVGSPPLFYPLILAALIILRPFPKWIFFAIFSIVFLTIDDTNRTMLLFTALIGTGYIAVNSIYHPTKSVILTLILIIGLFSAWNFLPENSKTHQRIVGLTELDLSKRTGSVGERQAEQDAVTLKLQNSGTTIEWVGLGFGGVYDVKFTHQYLTNSGHAHYSWVWFNLRFGKIGYLYLFIFISALLYNGTRSLNLKTDTGLFVSFLCLSGLIYCFTFVNSIFLLSGLHFLYYIKGHADESA